MRRYCKPSAAPTLRFAGGAVHTGFIPVRDPSLAGCSPVRLAWPVIWLGSGEACCRFEQSRHVVLSPSTCRTYCEVHRAADGVEAVKRNVPRNAGMNSENP